MAKQKTIRKWFLVLQIGIFINSIHSRLLANTRSLLAITRDYSQLRFIKEEDIKFIYHNIVLD
jgi:hypothetical protein